MNHIVYIRKLMLTFRIKSFYFDVSMKPIRTSTHTAATNPTT